MDCFDRFKRKMMLSGGSIRDEHVQDSKNLLQEVFWDDASLTHGLYFWSLGKYSAESYVDDTELDIRLFNRAFSNANGWMVQFQTLYNLPVDMGDILYDTIRDEYLMCTEAFDIDGIHWQGKLTMCNWMAKWQKKNGEILIYPCIDQNTTQYNSGETANRNFTIGTSQHMLTLPKDENTVILNTPQRFFLDYNYEKPTAFIVSQNDTTSYHYGKKGVVKVTLMEDVLRPDVDRIDLGICDYIDPESLDTDTSEDVKISKAVISYDTTVIRSGGDRQKFVAEFYDENGALLPDIIPNWEIKCEFENYLEVEQSGNEIWIGIDNDDYVDEEFKLILTDGDGLEPATLLVKIESIY